MRWVLFLSRLAFVCNVFFLLAVSLQLAQWFQNQDAEALIIIIGYFLAALINPVANLCYLYMLVGNRRRLQTVPVWLIVSNAVFLILQLLYLIYLNGTQHP